MPQQFTVGIRGLLKPEIDKRASRQVKQDLEDDLKEVEEIQPDMGGPPDWMQQMGPGPGSGTGGAVSSVAGGGGGGGGGGGLLESASGMLGGGGAGGLAKFALGGAVAVGMLSTLSTMKDLLMAASPALQQTAKLFGTAMELFFRPFGNFLDDLFRPATKDLLKMAKNFNQIASDQGLSVAINWLESSVYEGFTDAMAGALEWALGGLIDLLQGDVSLDNLFDVGEIDSEWLVSNFIPAGGALTTWADILDKVEWGSILDKISWPKIGKNAILGIFPGGIGAKLLLDHIGWPDDIGEFQLLGMVGWPDDIGVFQLLGMIDWPSNIGVFQLLGMVGWPHSIGVFQLLGMIDWPTIEVDDIVDKLTGGGGGNRGRGWGAGNPLTGRPSPQQTGGVIPRPTKTLAGEAGPEVIIPLGEVADVGAKMPRPPQPRGGGQAPAGGGSEALDRVVSKIDELLREVRGGGQPIVLEVDGQRLGEVTAESAAKFGYDRQVSK